MRAVRDYGRPLVDDPARTEGVDAVGVDETAFLAARAGSHTQFVTGCACHPDQRTLPTLGGESPFSSVLRRAALLWRRCFGHCCTAPHEGLELGVGPGFCNRSFVTSFPITSVVTVTTVMSMAIRLNMMYGYLSLAAIRTPILVDCRLRCC